MGLTVAEKDHFRKQLQSRTDQLIENLKGGNPTWERDLVAQAELKAEEVLNTRELLDQLAALEVQRVAIVETASRLTNDLTERITGMQAGNVPTSHRHRYGEPEDYMQYPDAARDAFRGQVKYEREMLMLAHPIGAEIVRIRDLCRDHTNAISMAGSHKQLQEAWAKVLEVLDGVEPDQRNARNVRIRDDDGKEKGKTS